MNNFILENDFKSYDLNKLKNQILLQIHKLIPKGKIIYLLSKN
jgi:hypothetical protein